MRARTAIATLVLVGGASVAIAAFLLAGLGVVLAVAAAIVTLIVVVVVLGKD